MGETMDVAGGAPERVYRPPATLSGTTPMKFPPEKCRRRGIKEGKMSGMMDVELSLGLSLHGMFGVDPAAKNRERTSLQAALAGCSAEGECGKRKEPQLMRKAVEKRKRIGKRRLLEDVEGDKLPCQSPRAAVAVAEESSQVSDTVEAESDTPQGMNRRSSVERRMAGRGEGEPAGEGDGGGVVVSVSATGDGPNGKRVEGFLYEYTKGEDVRILCVCHGAFLSPAQFLQHAGSLHVDHPLRHIVVRMDPRLPFPLHPTPNPLLSAGRCH